MPHDAHRPEGGLRSIRPTDPVAIERKRMALELLGDVRRLDQQLAAISERIDDAVVASGTSVTEVFGIGSILGATIVGHAGHVARFPTAGHFARYNATAPIEASSGPRIRHRLTHAGTAGSTTRCTSRQSPRSRTTPPGASTSNGSSPRARPAKEALRALKRRISDAVYRQLLTDARR